MNDSTSYALSFAGRFVLSVFMTDLFFWFMFEDGDDEQVPIEYKYSDSEDGSFKFEFNSDSSESSIPTIYNFTEFSGCILVLSHGFMSYLAARTTFGKPKVMDALVSRPNDAASIFRNAGARAGLRATIYYLCLRNVLEGMKFMYYGDPLIGAALIMASPISFLEMFFTSYLPILLLCYSGGGALIGHQLGKQFISSGLSSGIGSSGIGAIPALLHRVLKAHPLDAVFASNPMMMRLFSMLAASAVMLPMIPMYDMDEIMMMLEDEEAYDEANGYGSGSGNGNGNGSGNGNGYNDDKSGNRGPNRDDDYNKWQGDRRHGEGEWKGKDYNDDFFINDDDDDDDGSGGGRQI